MFLRMKDLIRESGLPRKTIHYYISEGLLPPGRKTGRNTAVYGREHQDRLQEICILREQKFLPVKAIKAYYNGEAVTELSQVQQTALRDLRLYLPEFIRPGSEQYLNYDSVVPAGSISQSELDELVSERLIELVDNEGEWLVSKEDAVVLESWLVLKEIGFSPENGFSPSILKIWDSAIEQLVQKEVAGLHATLNQETSDETVTKTSILMSAVSRLISALHYKKTRNEFTKRQP